MKLTEYIKPIGNEAAAKLFGVKKSTLRSWLYTSRHPRPATANKIVKVTGGKVSLKDIYGSKE